LDVELFFEKVGAALGVTKVFSDIATGFNLKRDGTTLEGGVEIDNALAMRMIETLGDAHQGGEAARDALVRVIERGIRGMVAGGFGLAVVVADNSSNDGAVAAIETGNIAV